MAVDEIDALETLCRRNQNGHPSAARITVDVHGIGRKTVAFDEHA